jgi:gamma-glutamyl-gamma-aminobutyrate hydrolase PuuD
MSRCGSSPARSRRVPAGAERVAVKSHHHQGVAKLGHGLVASGWSEDDQLVETIELPGRVFVLGVLWHPEEDPEDRLIPAFVAAAYRCSSPATTRRDRGQA